ncbi:hypothetical protein FD755_000211, partial [Muntiacus reevesi]
RKTFHQKCTSSNHNLKKCIKTPEIPSKHVRNWVPKVLEQRRQGLETYLQTVKHLPAMQESWRNLVGYSLWGFKESDTTEKIVKEPSLVFHFPNLFDHQT